MSGLAIPSSPHGLHPIPALSSADFLAYYEALTTGNVARVRDFVENKFADPSCSFFGNETPLHIVLGDRAKPPLSDDELLGTIHFLLIHKASPDKVQHYGTPLAIAARSPRAQLRLPLVELLLSHGADANARWYEGYSPPEWHSILVYSLTESPDLSGHAADVATVRRLLDAKADPVKGARREVLTPAAAVATRSCPVERHELEELLREYSAIRVVASSSCPAGTPANIPIGLSSQVIQGINDVTPDAPVASTQALFYDQGCLSP
jgi:hypothetical protein